MELVKAGGFSLLCSRSPDIFDIPGALVENTHNLRAILDALGKGGLKGVMPTGSADRGPED
jgi:hypothetical protein